jgi:rhodanese-related sulfurtransferase
VTSFFAGQGSVIQDMVHLTPREALDAIGRGALLVDVREDFMIEMKILGLPEMLFLPRSRFKELYEGLPRGRPLILADCVGIYSKEAVAFLVGHGFTEVANLNGGVSAWEEAGLPMNIDPDRLWTGSCMCQLKPRRDS